MYYAEACNELAGPISASLRPGNTVFDLTSPKFEPQIFRFRDERVTARAKNKTNKAINFALIYT